MSTLQYHNESQRPVVVIKFGGNALTEATSQAFCQVVAQLPELGFSPVIVHGGGPQVNAVLETVGVQSHFVNGLRYTDEVTLRWVEMALSGEVNRMLVQHLGQQGMSAVGISGKDGKTVLAKRITQDDDGNPLDLGCVGEITAIRPHLLQTLLTQGFVPVIAPIAYGEDGNTYNINADYVAAALARALSARHFVLMTNIQGLVDGQKRVIHHATPAMIQQLIADKVIVGGMIPKTLAAVKTLDSVKEVNIIDGREAQHLLDVLSQKTIGTRIVAD